MLIVIHDTEPLHHTCMALCLHKQEKKHCILQTGQREASRGPSDQTQGLDDNDLASSATESTFLTGQPGLDQPHSNGQHKSKQDSEMTLDILARLRVY